MQQWHGPNGDFTDQRLDDLYSQLIEIGNTITREYGNVESPFCDEYGLNGEYPPTVLRIYEKETA